MPSGRPLPLDGEVAVVTGALGNLGPVWCGALMDAGARVFALDLRDAPLPAALAARAGERLAVHKADIRDADALRAALAACLERCGAPTVLVNNAGIDAPPVAAPKTYRVEDWPLEQFRAVVDLNLSHTFSVSQVFG